MNIKLTLSLVLTSFSSLQNVGCALQPGLGRGCLRDAGASVSAGDYVLTQDLAQCLAFWKYSLDWHRSNAEPGRPDVGQSDNFNAKYLSFNQ